MKNPDSFPDFAYELERIAIIWETRIFKKKKGTKDYYPLLCSLVLWVLDRFLQPTSLLNRYEGQQFIFGFSFWVFTLLETNSIITWVTVLRQMVCPLSCRVLYRLISFPWHLGNFEEEENNVNYNQGMFWTSHLLLLVIDSDRLSLDVFTKMVDRFFLFTMIVLIFLFRYHWK